MTKQQIIEQTGSGGKMDALVDYGGGSRVVKVSVDDGVVSSWHCSEGDDEIDPQFILSLGVCDE